MDKPLADVFGENKSRATVAPVDSSPPPSYEHVVSLKEDSANGDSALRKPRPISGGYDPAKDERTNSLAVSCHNFLYRTLSQVECRVNLDNAKLVCVAVLLFLVSVRAGIYLFTGLPVSCVCQVDSNPALRHNHCSVEALLGRGMPNGAEGGWQPIGCAVHDYSQRALGHCFRNRASSYVKFVGDERIRTLYQRYVAQFTCPLEVLSCEQDSRSCVYSNPALGVMLEFAERNCSMPSELSTMCGGDAVRLPEVLVLGAAAWSVLKHEGAAAGLDEYRGFVERLVDTMKELSTRGVKILWALQEPVIEARLSPENAVLTNERLSQYNDVAANALKGDHVTIWQSFRELARLAPVSPCFDGFVHDYTSDVRGRDVMVLNNLLCNGNTNDTVCSCCATTYPLLSPFTPLQIATLSFLACLLLAGLLALALGGTRYRFLQPSPAYTVSLALGRAALVVALVVFCDRTQFFEKRATRYATTAFWVPLALLLIVGSAFTKRAVSGEAMRRAVVEEWKGWMQVVLLMCNLTGADHFLPLHMLTRVITSAYLFLAGHEIYAHLWHGGQPSLRHYARHLFELNFAAVPLCFALGNNYQFYAIVPLVTFWYSLFYCLMAVRPIMTAAALYGDSLYAQLTLMTKFCAAVALIVGLYMGADFFNKFFSFPLWRGLFAADGKVNAWRDNFSVDRHTAFAGMLVTAFLVLMQHHRSVTAATWAAVAVRFFALLGGVAGVVAYVMFALSCETRAECDAAHAYVAVVPLLSYAAVRWATAPAVFSTGFAWLGGMWVELTVLQCHLLMGADGRGVLDLLPGCAIANVLLTGFVLVCAADEMRGVAVAMKKYAVPDDWRMALANFFVLLLILVPVNVLSFY